jgi:hypothetical protein
LELKILLTQSSHQKTNLISTYQSWQTNQKYGLIGDWEMSNVYRNCERSCFVGNPVSVKNNYREASEGKHNCPKFDVFVDNHSIKLHKRYLIIRAKSKIYLVGAIVYNGEEST